MSSNREPFARHTVSEALLFWQAIGELYGASREQGVSLLLFPGASVYVPACVRTPLISEVERGHDRAELARTDPERLAVALYLRLELRFMVQMHANEGPPQNRPFPRR